MRSILEIIIALVIAAAFFVGLGFLLPSSAKIERKIEIERPAIHIYDAVNTMSRFPAWQPWTFRDPAAPITYNDIKSGEGAKASWTSSNPDVGTGFQEILPGGEKEKLIKMRLNLGPNRDGMGAMKIEAQEIGSKVTMTYETKFNGLLDRYKGLYLDSEQGDKLTLALSSLKATLENSPYAGDYAAVPIEIKELAEQPALQMSYTSRGYTDQPLNVPRDRQYTIETIQKVIASNNLTAGPAQFLETSRDNTAYVVTFDTTIPVDKTEGVKLSGDVKAVMTTAGKFLVATHIGRRDSWDLPAQTKEKAFAYAAVHDMRIASMDSGRRIFAEYLSGNDTPEGEFRTNVYIPIE
jgi:hypothetical protein